MKKLKESMELKCSIIDDENGPHLKIIVPVGKASPKKVKKRLVELRKMYNEELTINTSTNWNIIT